jgi:protein-disulfide isomerase
MKLNMKFISLSVVGALALSGAAHAAEQDVAAQVKANFGAVSPQISAMDVTVDAHRTAYFKESTGTDTYTVVNLGTQAYLVDAKGTSLVSPSNAFVVAHNKIMPASHVFTKYEFDNGGAAKNWPVMPVDEGVEKQGVLYVFSDPTCSYCVKVEKEMPTYAANGVEVRYVPWPRSGINPGTPNYDKWATAMCAENPGQAYHDITLGKNLDAYKDVRVTAACTSLIAEGYALGQRIGVSGTPFMYLQSNAGEMVLSPGYQPAASIMGSAGLNVKYDGASALGGAQ